ncbi:MAG TPA: SIMPL domain-containing protein [Terriglobales bacterium]|nr:SIMPL domain-containing protein [Terriglobales bacterium]
MDRKIVVVLVAFILLVGRVQICLAQETCPHPRLISVVGTAEINVNPDQAVLSLGVDSHDKVLAAAKSENDRRVKKVLGLARAVGVEQKDVQTSSLQMEPDYSEEKIPRLLGYQVSQTIAITLKDLTKYEALMTQLLEAGVNRVYGVRFIVGEDRKYRDEARAKAITAAKEKAVAMASQLGQTIGKPWEISEEHGGNIFSYGAFANSVQTRSGGGGEGAEESTVAPGQVTIRASVDVSFLLE